jgi:glutamyl-tRNA reductase
VLICLSASHRNAGFDLLEQLSVIADDTAERMLERHDALAGAVVVSTCNRFEAYLDVEPGERLSPIPAVHEAVRVVSDAAGVDHDGLRSSLQLLHGNEVAAHLFSVAAGLESVVVGEGEIAGQVRRALEHARRAGTTTPELERLFQRASRTSRSVKNRTGLGSAGRSLVRLALDLAESRVTDWRHTRVLLVGTGQYAGASLAALRERGVADVRVHSPSGRAARFAASHGIEAVGRNGFDREAALADVIITCTTAEGHVLDAALLRAGLALAQNEAVGARGDEPLPLPSPVSSRGASAHPDDAARRLIIDLGLPRNVDSDVAGVPGVELLDLETIRIHAPLEELGATDAAREIVGRAARAFLEVGEELDLTPAVVALRSHVFDILDAEVERARARGDDDGRTEAALRHMAGVLLHTPMVRSRVYARANEQRAWVEGLEAIFGVTPASPAADVRLHRDVGGTNDAASAG